MRRFLALGDSYTIGEGVAPAESWPAQLHARFAEAEIEMEQPVIVAQTGWTTAELAAGIRAAAPAGDFSVASLLIGVNNQYRGGLLGAFRAEFRKLLGAAIDFTGAPRRVLVLTMPDWGVTPFAEGKDRDAIAAHIDRFNHVIREAARERWAPCVDITTSSRRHGGDPRYLAPDRLHPSAVMYADWVRIVEPEVLKALGIRNN